MSGSEKWVGDTQPPVPSPPWDGSLTTNLLGVSPSRTTTESIAWLTLPSPAASRLVYYEPDCSIVSIKFDCAG